MVGCGSSGLVKSDGTCLGPVSSGVAAPVGNGAVRCVTFGLGGIACGAAALDRRGEVGWNKIRMDSVPYGVAAEVGTSVPVLNHLNPVASNSDQSELFVRECEFV